MAGISIKGRIASALRCPWCADTVRRDEAKICPRPDCAVYHRECWDECVELHGACAVTGCEETQAPKADAASFFRRVIQVLVSAHGELVTYEQRARERRDRDFQRRNRDTHWIGVALDRNNRKPLTTFEQLLFCGGLVGAGLGMAWVLTLRHVGTLEYAVPVLAAALGVFVVLGIAVGLFTLRGLARGDLGEFERALDDDLPARETRVRPRERVRL